jgi:hypothetical protein
MSGNFVQYLASHGVHVAVAYQPVSRYWPLQWTETGIYLVLALGLGGICYWRVRRLIELRDGKYEAVAEVTGDEHFRARLPFPVTIRPATLVRTGPLD